MTTHERLTKCPRCDCDWCCRKWLAPVNMVERTGTYDCHRCHVQYSFHPTWWDFSIYQILTNGVRVLDQLIIHSDGYSTYFNGCGKETKLPFLPFDISAERLQLLLLVR